MITNIPADSAYDDNANDHDDSMIDDDECEDVADADHDFDIGRHDVKRDVRYDDNYYVDKCNDNR